jgi:hypothetical protein
MLVPTIFQSRALIFTGRITLLVVAGFIVLSILARIWNRQWLSKAGPFEVSTAMADVEHERDALREEVVGARRTIESLEAEVERLTICSDARQGDDGGHG